MKIRQVRPGCSMRRRTRTDKHDAFRNFANAPINKQKLGHCVHKTRYLNSAVFVTTQHDREA